MVEKLFNKRKRYVRQLIVLVGKLKDKYLNKYQIFKFAFIAFFSISLFLTFLFVFVFYSNNLKLLFSINDIKDEFSVGISFFRNNEDFDVKESILLTMQESFKAGKLSRFYVVVFTENEFILQDSTLYESILKDVPKNRIVFLFNFIDEIDFCTNMPISQINKFIGFSNKNTLIKISTYCNFLYRYNVGVVSSNKNESLDFLDYIQQVLYSIIYLAFNNIFNEK